MSRWTRSVGIGWLLVAGCLVAACAQAAPSGPRATLRLAPASPVLPSSGFGSQDAAGPRNGTAPGEYAPAPSTPSTSCLPAAGATPAAETPGPASAKPSERRAPATPNATPGSARDAWVGECLTAADVEILDRLPGHRFSTCERAGLQWPDQLDAVVCSNDDVAVTYGLFPDAPSMQTDYQADVAAAKPPPSADSQCSTGAFESGYELAGVHTGRLLCTTYQANGVTYRVMEWTNESLAMIAWADTADLDWPAFIAFANGAREH